MKLLVTGASGHLGRLVVDSLLERGVPASDVVVIARTPESVADLAERGVEVRRADYDDRTSLDAALADVDRMLLVSGSAVGQRIAQHTNVIEAAKAAGVGFVAYTSITRADASDLVLAAEHRATEELLAASGLPHALLRNSWYLENYTGQVGTALEHGVVLGAAGTGRVSAATRADYADAAAVVLAGEGHEGQVYELGGDEAFTLGEYAAVLSRVAGREIAYRDLSVDEYTAALVATGLPQGYAAVLADGDRGLAQGALFTDSGDLSRLIGRPTTDLEAALHEALAVTAA
ncbi:NAD(P)H dehydrogenase (quinone) [Humibacillus xanthopallidus]|uniref:NAD(P)H dehydrogenase (Quinone) n=1 Tax=Humibacillus xanthopallidus TaxID=412689 RepID=A0A543PY11_9MICO|nr:SDR family oxidoreductase [Humibacillus xanthopallidus]TQN48978.1 NAD(P)H dehydrogenase (quinone) [Humibacillus xanthopallidus]